MELICANCEEKSEKSLLYTVSNSFLFTTTTAYTEESSTSAIPPIFNKLYPGLTLERFGELI